MYTRTHLCACVFVLLLHVNGIIYFPTEKNTISTFYDAAEIQYNLRHFTVYTVRAYQ